MDQIPAAMDRHLDVIQPHKDGGILLGASGLTGRYWLGSLWFYENPDLAPDVEKCTAGVQLESGVSDVQWVDSTRMVVALDTGRVELWNLVDSFHTFTHLQSATEHDDLISTLSVSCDQNSVVSGSHDLCIKVWDLEKNTCLHSYKAHAALLTGVACHLTQPDLFLSCAEDKQLLLWDRRKAKPARHVDRKLLTGSPTCVSWQPGSEHLVGVGSETGDILITDTRMVTDKPLYYSPHTRTVHKLQFSPQCPFLLCSVSEDCSVVVSDISSDTIKQIYQSRDHKDFVRGMAWLGADNLYTCAWDSKVKSHHVTSQDKADILMDVNSKKCVKTPDMENEVGDKCVKTPDMENEVGDKCVKSPETMETLSWDSCVNSPAMETAGGEKCVNSPDMETGVSGCMDSMAECVKGTSSVAVASS